jgi:glycosyltransferase involved in cell wall biosynthesis
MIDVVAVVIPASDEQALISFCLDALAVARARVVDQVEVRVVVVLDNCTDNTDLAVANYPWVETVRGHFGSAGSARAAGVRYLRASCVNSPSSIWLANTDADSTVPPNWLSIMLAEAEGGTHLVLGTVLPERGLREQVERAWFRCHRLVDGHPHVHGANFGIRADVYQELGGWSEIANGEDEALVAAASLRTGMRIARLSAIGVRTSSRLVGRATEGFAKYLYDLDASLVIDQTAGPAA